MILFTPSLLENKLILVAAGVVDLMKLTKFLLLFQGGVAAAH